MTPRQADHVRDLRALAQEHDRLVEARKAYAGGVTWKEVGRHVYLARFWTQDGRKTFRYEGKRSRATERVHDAFLAERNALDARIATSTARVEEAARVGKALKLGRIPVPIADVLRRLARAGLTERGMVLGDACLSAYEALACRALPAFAKASETLTIMVPDEEMERFALATLRAGERHGMERVAGCGFTWPGGPDIRLVDRTGLARLAAGDQLDDGQLVAVMWAIDEADPVRTIGVGRDGAPVPMRVPEPRAYALLMLGLSASSGRSEPTPEDAARIDSVAALTDVWGDDFEPRHARAFDSLADLAPWGARY